MLGGAAVARQSCAPESQHQGALGSDPSTRTDKCKMSSGSLPSADTAQLSSKNAAALSFSSSFIISVPCGATRPNMRHCSPGSGFTNSRGSRSRVRECAAVRTFSILLAGIGVCPWEELEWQYAQPTAGAHLRREPQRQAVPTYFAALKAIYALAANAFMSECGATVSALG